jgi:hypothetical protein
MIVHFSRGQPSHQAGSLAMPAGAAGATSNPQRSKNAGMIVAR